MRRRKFIFFTVIFILVIASISVAMDPPHTSDLNVTCANCHNPSVTFTYATIDNTPWNEVCWSCHDFGASGSNFESDTHSAISTGDDTAKKYWGGAWTNECRRCHDPHTNEQARAYMDFYPAGAWLYTGTIQASTYNTITVSGNPWGDDDWVGKTLQPQATGSFFYRIIDSTSNSLVVAGTMWPFIRMPGGTFAISYGKLIRAEVTTRSNVDKFRTVKFLNSSGASSFADGNGVYDGICEVCHSLPTHFGRDGSASDQLHANIGGGAGRNCMQCHAHTSGFGHGKGAESCGSSTGCHDAQGSHNTHVGGPQLDLECSECHDTSDYPRFADGVLGKDSTTVCDNCHTVGGVALAKSYWNSPGSDDMSPGSWLEAEGEASFCGSCHDTSPGNTRRDGTGGEAYNVMGDNSTFGFYITGHGKDSGNYGRLSYQAQSDTGNPSASESCGACHDFGSQHFNTSDKRLKTGMENDQSNANCKTCHSYDGSEGTAATNAPHFYTTSSDYEGSVHGGKLCTECHDVHGTASGSGTYAGMTRNDQESLCYDCHPGQAGHSLGTQFGRGGLTYTLECVSCHNVHIITGMYNTSDPGKGPVTKPSDVTSVWGDGASEKMDTYAGSGTYRTPNGDLYNGTQLMDYPDFCLDCHGGDMSPSIHGSIDWTGDPHGKQSANQPKNYDACPNFWSCGVSYEYGWNGDDCVATEDTCWPVTAWGRGDTAWSKSPFEHEERISGANFTLSCSDCHVTHEAGTGEKLRLTVNNGPGSHDWTAMCNNCHWFYSNWHGGACGVASCHHANSIHRMDDMAGSDSTRTFNPDLVLHYAFEGTLKDSGTWQMDGKWYATAGSFASGKSGSAAVFGGGVGVQVGTEDGSWSTVRGAHGTWKYTEMKYNTTLEAWVYPTDDAGSEYTVFSKHVGYNDGGYGFFLRKIDGSLRAVMNVNVIGKSIGVRGAYSSVDVPLNTWTHVAASFDTAGPDMDPDDLSVGRIRIYVNGEDVTTGGDGAYAQPGAGEDYIFPYSDHSPGDEAVCNGNWCASEFSIGGFPDRQYEFIGRIDEAKVWNITKDASYFEATDQASPPRISRVEGFLYNNQLTVTFTEGVYAGIGQTGSLDASDFVLTDVDNGRTILTVVHTAGAATAVLTLSSALDETDDLNLDTVAAAPNSIYDEYDNAADGSAVTITPSSSACPAGQVIFNLNEAPGNSYVLDDQNMLYGLVNGVGTLTGSAYSGDGVNNFVDFEHNGKCLQAKTAMTLEARIKPSGLEGTNDYVKRILARDSGGNYELSVWRETGWGSFSAPSDTASIALWLLPVDIHGGNPWKVVLTDYDACPIVSGHWYEVKAVWNSNKPGGTPGEFFVPADIYVDDQGTDGLGSGENWSGLANCTNSSQSYSTDDMKLYTGDEILTADGDFTIGTNVNNHSIDVFEGLIDWIKWQSSAE